MLGPLSSILAVPAKTYTVLQTTLDSLLFRGEEARGSISDGSRGKTSVNADAADSRNFALSALFATNGGFTRLSSTLEPPLLGSGFTTSANVEASSSSFKTLWACTSSASRSPCLVRRAEVEEPSLASIDTPSTSTASPSLPLATLSTFTTQAPSSTEGETEIPTPSATTSGFLPSPSPSPSSSSSSWEADTSSNGEAASASPASSSSSEMSSTPSTSPSSPSSLTSSVVIPSTSTDSSSEALRVPPSSSSSSTFSETRASTDWSPGVLPATPSSSSTISEPTIPTDLSSGVPPASSSTSTSTFSTATDTLTSDGISQISSSTDALSSSFSITFSVPSDTSTTVPRSSSSLTVSPVPSSSSFPFSSPPFSTLPPLSPTSGDTTTDWPPFSSFTGTLSMIPSGSVSGIIPSASSGVVTDLPFSSTDVSSTASMTASNSTVLPSGTPSTIFPSSISNVTGSQPSSTFFIPSQTSSLPGFSFNMTTVPETVTSDPSGSSTFAFTDPVPVPSTTLPPSSSGRTWTTRNIGATVIMSSTLVITRSSSSPPLETVTSTYVTSNSGAAMTVTTVIVGPSGSLNNGGENKKNLSSGAIAAIVIVSGLAVAAVGLWIFIALRRRKRRDRLQNLDNAAGGRDFPGLNGSPGKRPSRPSIGGFGVAAYDAGGGKRTSSGLPLRISPLQGEDEDLEVQNSDSAHSGLSGGPGSLVGGVMRETTAPNQGIGAAILPRWTAANVNAPTSDPAGQQRFSNRYSFDDLRQAGLPEAAGLESRPRPPMQSSPYGYNEGPFASPARGSFGIDTPPGLAGRSSSPPLVSNAPSSLLPSRTAAPENHLVDGRTPALPQRASRFGLKRSSVPPSAWALLDNQSSERRSKDEVGSASPGQINEPNTETFGRVHGNTSMESSSSGHGHGHENPGVTSSQGHGSATASGENENAYSSSSPSSGSHQASSASHNKAKRRSTGVDGSFFSRAASFARSSLRAPQRRSTGSEFDRESVDTSMRTIRPLSPVSRLVTTNSSASSPSPVTPSSTAFIRPPSQTLQSITLHSPNASPEGMRTFGRGTTLTAIPATPPLLRTPDEAPDGLLDPRLAARLREIHDVQSSVSTIGLRDHEDYTRPIFPLVNNRDSLTSSTSEYSQPSDHAPDDNRTPSRTQMTA